MLLNMCVLEAQPSGTISHTEGNAHSCLSYVMEMFLPYVARCVLSLASSGVQSYSNFNSHLTDCGIPFLLQAFCLDAEPKVKKIESDFVSAKVRTACTMSCTLEHQHPKWLMPLGTCPVDAIGYMSGC